jgi:hypothetical protein
VAQLQGDGLELGALLQVQVVKQVLVVLEEVEVTAGTAVAEGVHADDFLTGRFQSLLTRLAGKGRALVIFLFTLVGAGLYFESHHS